MPKHPFTRRIAARKVTCCDQRQPERTPPTSADMNAMNGTAIHGFELRHEQTVAEANSIVRLYRHAKTGAQLLSLANSDENKVFGAAFRTPTTDSTGVAHILEHSVLCGSRKYAAKKPFVELMKGSLNTF